MSRTSGQVNVTTSGEVDIASLTQFVLNQVSAAGKGNLDARLTFQQGETLLVVKSRVTGVEIARAGTAEVNPTDLAIEGQTRLTSKTMSAEVSLSGQAGRQIAHVC